MSLISQVLHRTECVPRVCCGALSRRAFPALLDMRFSPAACGPFGRRSRPIAFALFLASFVNSIASPAVGQGAPFTQPLPTSVAAGQVTLRANAGQALAGGPDVLCVGAPGNSVRGFDAGSVVVYRRDPVSGAFYVDQRLQPSSLSSYDRFGGAVALSGDLLVVGAKGDDTSGPNSGAVYVFRRATASQPFVLLDRLAPPGLGANACYGASVAASGNTFAVGAPRTDVSGFWTGSVYTYTIDSTTNVITPAGVVTDVSGSVGDEFGSAVAVSPNELFVASERLDMPNGPDDVGGVVRFVRQGGAGWVLSQRLFPTLPSEGARFGAALALEPPRPGAPGTLVVGAPEASPLGALGARGAVFVYTAGFGGSWSSAFQHGWWIAQTGSMRGRRWRSPVGSRSRVHHSAGPTSGEQTSSGAMPAAHGRTIRRSHFPESRSTTLRGRASPSRAESRSSVCPGAR